MAWCSKQVAALAWLTFCCRLAGSAAKPTKPRAVGQRQCNRPTVTLLRST
jgi:hypothetical protein